MQRIFEEIIKQQRPCYFISPHLDDAILSSGDLIHKLARKTNVTAITLFTESSEPPYTFAAKGFLRHAGYKNARALFGHRRREDAEIFTKLGVAYHHLGFQDSSFREKSTPDILSKLLGSYLGEARCVYPIGTYQKTISPLDKKLMQQIEEKLKTIIVQDNAIIFCPLAIGKNIDHQITRNVSRKIGKNILYWADFPYSVANPEEKEFIEREKLMKFVHTIENHEIKDSLIKIYKTQFLPMFPNGKVPHKDEVFYCSK